MKESFSNSATVLNSRYTCPSSTRRVRTTSGLRRIKTTTSSRIPDSTPSTTRCHSTRGNRTELIASSKTFQCRLTWPRWTQISVSSDPYLTPTDKISALTPFSDQFMPTIGVRQSQFQGDMYWHQQVSPARQHMQMMPQQRPIMQGHYGGGYPQMQGNN